ncbi:MAG: hypothetical protein GFH27_549411n44 [Chloroflexi bacterium AL-W]|nr:hypothetical protein [Chloroflexi bacterium AL-W]
MVVGLAGISVLLVVMGLLSHRLGRVTRAKRYYVGFFLGALLVAISAVVRLWQPPEAVDLTESVLWLLLYHGAPAIGLTLGVVTAWRYWSWLLAERN